MPFRGQNAGKTGHEDILLNPDVEQFLRDHADVPRPDAEQLSELFDGVPSASSFSGALPDLVMAIDGSAYEASADPREPSRRVGYLKAGLVALDMKKYRELGGDGQRFVDPMAVARLQNSSALSMALPGAHMKQRQFGSVAEGYRFHIQRYYAGESTRIGTSKQTLLDTFVNVLRYGDFVINDQINIGRCANPDCDSTDDVFVASATNEGDCPACKERAFTVDALRVHDCFVESGSNAESYGRLMSVSEHLLAAHYILHLANTSLETLSRIAFVMDGPLSISGEGAKIARALIPLLHDVNQRLAEHGLPPLLVMGLTKTGIAVDHFMSLDASIPTNKAFAVTDKYRYDFITPRPNGESKRPIFGKDFYYGQDVLVKTQRGHQFLVSVAYPWATKTELGFKNDRFDLSHYPSMGRAMSLLTTLESDLYRNSMIPVILAHEYASISLAPGGKVLDLATSRALSNA